MDTFVYDNIEVRKTGRKATRKLNNTRTDELIEVTPKDTDSGTWKKWVREVELFEVQGGTNETVQ